jgi:hypothetical protein
MSVTWQQRLQRTKNYGTELATSLVESDYRNCNAARRRLELSLTLTKSDEFVQGIVASWPGSSCTAEDAVVTARRLTDAVSSGKYNFLYSPYGAESSAQFMGHDIKLLKDLMPAVNMAILGGSGATHLNPPQIRALLRQVLLGSCFDLDTTNKLYHQTVSTPDRGKLSAVYNSDALYMMGAQAVGMPHRSSSGQAMFPPHFSSSGPSVIGALSGYGGYYREGGKPFASASGEEVPYYINYTQSVTENTSSSSSPYVYYPGGTSSSRCGGFVKFKRDVNLLLYDIRASVVLTRASPYLVPLTAWKRFTPERIGNLAYLKFLTNDARHMNKHDLALTSGLVGCGDESKLPNIIAAPFKSLVIVGSDKETQMYLNRALRLNYERNPMYATSDNVYCVTSAAFSRDQLPGMLVRGDMAAKASDVNSGQGNLMSIYQPSNPGAIGFFYSGYDKISNRHTIDIGIIPDALDITFEPSDALKSTEMIGSVSMFSHWEHERILRFFFAHRPDLYDKIDARELWGKKGEYSEYSKWIGDLEKLFIVLVGVHSKLYNGEVGNTIHSLGMVNTGEKNYNILDAFTMVEEINDSEMHRALLRSDEFTLLGKAVLAEYFEELLLCGPAADAVDISDIKKIACK